MRTVLMVAMLVTAAAAPAFAQERLADQLRKGIVEEEAGQNLDKAIQAYQAVVARYDQDRKTAATAVFRLAECYRKAGKREQAIAAYQRVVREFADQSAIVEPSRQQLAATYGVVDSREARPSAAATREPRGQAPRIVSPREVRPERQEATRERPAGSLEATKLEIDLLTKRLADVQKKVELGLLSPSDFEELRGQQAILLHQYQEQAKERDANLRADQESRLLTQQMIRSVEAEIVLLQQRIAQIEKNISANVGPPQQETEKFQLQRDMLGLQRRLDELKSSLKR